MKEITIGRYYFLHMENPLKKKELRENLQMNKKNH